MPTKYAIWQDPPAPAAPPPAPPGAVAPAQALPRPTRGSAYLSWRRAPAMAVVAPAPPWPNRPPPPPTRRRHRRRPHRPRARNLRRAGLPPPTFPLGPAMEDPAEPHPQPLTLNLAGDVTGDGEEGKRRGETKIWVRKLSKMFEYSIAFAEAKIGTIVRLNVKIYVCFSFQFVHRIRSVF